MDDSTLKALALVPRGSKEPLALVPPFARHTKAYTCMVQSDLEAVAVQAVCNEPDAFSQPQNTSSDGSIAIKEGANNVEVKVDAPDGSSSRYIVQVYRPSASDTSLKEVAVSAGTIVPPISRSETRYTVLIDPTLAKLTVNPVPLNAKSTIKWICPASPPVDTVLHIGDTAFQFDVTSANGSSTVSYTITARKDKVGPRLRTVDKVDRSLLCSICVCVVHQPRLAVSADGATCTHKYCHTCLDMFKKTMSVAPAAGDGADATPQVAVCCPLCPDKPGSAYTNNPLAESDSGAETAVSSLKAGCPYCATVVPQCEMASHVKGCKGVPQACAECDMYVDPAALNATTHAHKEPCTSSCSTCGVKVGTAYTALHARLCGLKQSVPQPSNPAVHDWETALVDRKTYAGPVESIVHQATAAWKTYTDSLASAVSRTLETRGQSHETPSHETLVALSKMYATAISLNTEAKALRSTALDETLHIGLGLVLEEQHACQESYPRQSAAATGAGSKPNENEAAAESFMADEVDGLLMQLAIPPSASDATKLKALETEYHRLLDNGLSDQAAEVQGLHAWKLKQMGGGKMGGGGGGGGEGDGGVGGSALLARACEKYRHAVQIAPSSFDANFHLGRCAILAGDHATAGSHLRLALALRPTSRHAKQFLGIAISAACDASMCASPPVLPSETDIADGVSLLQDALAGLQTQQWGPLVRPDIPLIASIPSPAPAPLICTSSSHSTAATSMTYLAASRLLALQGSPAATDVLFDLLHRLPDSLARLPRHSTAFARMAIAIPETQSEILVQPPSAASKVVQPSALLEVSTLMRGTTSSHVQTSVLERIAQRLCIASMSASSLALLGDLQYERGVDMIATFPTALDDAEMSYRSALGLLGLAPASDGIKDREWWRAHETRMRMIKDRLSAAKPAAATATAGSGGTGKKGAATGKAAPAPAGKAKPAATAPAAPVTGSTKPKPAAAPTTAATTAKPKTETAAVKPAAQPNSKPAANAAVAAKEPAKTAAKPAAAKPPGAAAGAAAVSKPGAKPAGANPPAAVAKAAKKADASTVQPAQPAQPAQATQPAETPAQPQQQPQPAQLSPADTETALRSLLGLARTLSHKHIPPSQAVSSETSSLYETALRLGPQSHDTYIDYASHLAAISSQSPSPADVYLRYPFTAAQLDRPSQDDLYIHTEIVAALVKGKQYRDERLAQSLVCMGRVQGIRSLSSVVEVLDGAGEGRVLMAVYAGVNRKPIDDPDLTAFFKSRYWL